MLRWSWRKLKKFWVDGVWLEGEIPSFIAQRWPDLQTLDLYDNNLTGMKLAAELS